jgi:hypothetical protein
MLYRNLLISFCLLFTTSLAIADELERHQRVDGMSVYLGVIPAQLIQEYSGGMHGGDADKEHRYHVLVALFDSKSGERIIDARIKATVSPLGLGGSTKELEVMHGELLSYGNYFTLHKPELYRIRVEIQREKGGAKSMANFVFRRPRD